MTSREIIDLERTMAFGIYSIVFPDNHIYIGSTIQSFARRKRAHWRHLFELKNHNNYKMLQLTQKYSMDLIEFRIVEQIRVRNMDLIIEREKYWIEHFSKTHILLNVAVPGGLGGQEVIDRMKEKLRTKEVRKKMSDKAKARVKKERQIPVKTKLKSPPKHNVKTNPKPGVKDAA